jgi:hypothetical protein
MDCRRFSLMLGIPYAGARECDVRGHLEVADDPFGDVIEVVDNPFGDDIEIIDLCSDSSDDTQPFRVGVTYKVDYIPFTQPYMPHFAKHVEGEGLLPPEEQELIMPPPNRGNYKMKVTGRGNFDVENPTVEKISIDLFSGTNKMRSSEVWGLKPFLDEGVECVRFKICVFDDGDRQMDDAIKCPDGSVTAESVYVSRADQPFEAGGGGGGGGGGWSG